MAKKKKATQTPVKKKDNQDDKPVINKTSHQLSQELVIREKEFYETDDRFIEIVINNKPVLLDLAGIWSTIEKMLKKAGITDETALMKYHNKSRHYQTIFLDIEKLKARIRKEKQGLRYRRQPVLREKGEWIVQQAGEFNSVAAIHRDLTLKQGYHLAIGTLRNFIAENKAAVDKVKDDYKTELLNGSIVIDSGRLKFWMEAYDYYYERWIQDRKQSDFNVCERIINNVRTEIKGDVTIKIDGKIDINHSLESAKNLGQKMGELNISLINIALAAQKNDVNPLLLMAQLTNSYYNKWNGIAEKPLAVSEKASLVPVSSLIKSYNWDEIRDKNSEAPERFETIQEAIIVEDKELQDVEGKKEKLLRLLRESEKTNL